jgi:hypothetical protein
MRDILNEYTSAITNALVKKCKGYEDREEIDRIKLKYGIILSKTILVLSVKE